MAGSNNDRPLPAHSSVTTSDCDFMLAKVGEAQAERPVDETADRQPECVGVEAWDLEVVADIEVRVRHHDTPEQRRDRGLAVERVRAMHDELGVERVLAGLFGIDRRHGVACRQVLPAAAACDDAGAGRGRINVQAASLLERVHEPAQLTLVACFHDEIHRVFPPYHGLTLDLHAVLPHVGTAEVIQQPGAHVRVLRGAVLGCVLMSDDEQRHAVTPHDSSRLKVRSQQPTRDPRS